MRLLLGLLVISSSILCQVACADGQPVALIAESNAVQQVDTPTLQDLKAENEALRRENQMLRRELVARRGTVQETVLPDRMVEPVATPDLGVGEETGYWLSQKSKIRHNARCRNYRKVKGRPCGPKDGKPCRMCGG